jgi:plasmid stabilization system protein ParE
MKPTTISTAADADLIAFYDRYLTSTGERIAEDFSKRTQEVLTHIQSFPRKGSTRYAHLIPPLPLQAEEDENLMMLRSWTYKQFPLIVFFIEHQDQTIILRVLHQATDIPAHLPHQAS